MKREIKFRDFDLDTNKVRYFDLDNYDRNEHNCYGNITEFTGLKDKNGKDIYEGDIVSVNRNFIGIVNYKNGSFIIENKEGKYYYLGEFVSYLGYEVISNIYENPELCPVN